LDLVFFCQGSIILGLVLPSPNPNKKEGRVFNPKREKVLRVKTLTRVSTFGVHARAR